MDAAGVEGRDRRALVLDLVLAGLLVGALVVTFAPWLRTGSATRSSYEVVRAADRLGLLDGGARLGSRLAWSTLPLVASLGLLALALQRRIAAVALAWWVALVQGLLAYALVQVPQVADGGARISLVISTMLVVVGAATLLDRRWGRRTVR